MSKKARAKKKRSKSAVEHLLDYMETNYLQMDDGKVVFTIPLDDWKNLRKEAKRKEKEIAMDLIEETAYVCERSADTTSLNDIYRVYFKK
jgi:hypothetical protein